MCVEHALKGKGGRKKLGSGRRRQWSWQKGTEGGEKEEEMEVWRRDMERRMGEWEKKSAEVKGEGRKKKRVVKDRKKVEGMKVQVKEGRIESKGEGKKT